MFLVFQVDFLFAKLEKKFPDFQIKKIKLPKKPRIRSWITQFLKNNKKWALSD